MAEKYSVAIDGPSGAGKSTLAKAAAAALGICYVDTGAIYRTIGYGVYRRGIDPSDAGAVAAVLPDMQLEMRYDQAGLQRMMLAGEDVTDQIRLPEMSRYASIVSAIPAVRDFLLELQREQPPQRHHGRPGHRHGGAAGCHGEDFPHRRAGGAGHAPLPGAGAARHFPAL